MKARLIAITIAAGGVALAIAGTMALASGPLVPGGLYPDFASAVPHHFTVQHSQQHEFLRFSNGIANIGDGAFRIRPENNPTTGITTGFQEVFDASGNMGVNAPVCTDE